MNDSEKKCGPIMGNKESKKTDSSGDAQVAVINKLETHSEDHSTQVMLLWVIVILLIIQLLLAAYKQYKKKQWSLALKAARSAAVLNV